MNGFVAEFVAKSVVREGCSVEVADMRAKTWVSVGAVVVLA